MCAGMASASTHNSYSFSLLPLGGRGGREPWNATSNLQTSVSSLGTANEMALLVPRHMEAAGSAGLYNLPSRCSPGDRLCTRRLQGCLGCPAPEGDTKRQFYWGSWKSSAVQRWWLSGCYKLCLIFVIFFFFSFCFSVSFGSHGLAFHFQNRHLIKLVTLQKLRQNNFKDEKRRKQKGLI